MRLNPLFSILFLFECLAFPMSWGGEVSSDLIATHLMPRVEFMGGLRHESDSTIGVGGAQVLIPFTQKADATDLWYGHIQGHYHVSDEQKLLAGSVGFGAGYRFQLNSEYQVGGYGLFDIYLSASQQKYFIFTPGLELHNNTWRLALNGVWPIRTTYYNEGDFSHKLGDAAYHRFTKHQEVDHYSQRTESVPMGIDLNGSLWINSQLSISLGGYYLKYIDEDVLGMRAGISYEPTPMLRFDIQGLYGKEPTLFAFVSFVLGDVALLDTQQDKLQVSIFRPNVPIKTSVYKDQGERLVNDHVYFYHPQGSGFECTAENPGGTTLSQAEIDKMPTGASIYLAEGAHYTLDTGDNSFAAIVSNMTEKVSALGRSLMKKVSLTKFDTPSISRKSRQHETQHFLVLDNKSLLGRSQDFRTSPENGTPILGVPIKITGKAIQAYPMKIEHINLTKAQGSKHWEAPGILISSAAHVQVQDINLVKNSLDLGKIKYGLQIEDSQNIAFSNSKIEVDGLLVGIKNSEKIRVKNNYFKAFTPKTSEQPFAEGLVISGGREITIEDNVFAIHSHLSAVGVTIDSNPIQLKIQGNRLELSQNNPFSEALMSQDEDESKRFVFGIKGKRREDVKKAFKDNTFILKAENGTIVKITELDTRKLQDKEMIIDEAGNAFTRFLVMSPLQNASMKEEIQAYTSSSESREGKEEEKKSKLSAVNGVLFFLPSLLVFGSQL